MGQRFRRLAGHVLLVVSASCAQSPARAPGSTGPGDAGQAVDAGGPIDAGPPVDAGGPIDAGPRVDAGGPIDAGVASDGGRGDGGPGTDAGNPDVEPFDQFFNDFVAADCAYYIRCGYTVALQEPYFADMATCIEYLSRLIDDNHTEIDLQVRAVDAGVAQYDPAAGWECIQAFYSRSCTSSAEYPGACFDAFFGSVPDGGACAANAQCLPGSRCAVSGVCPGTCQPLSDQSCDYDTNVPCSDDEGCSYLNDGGWGCVALGGSGEACQGWTDSDGLCQAGLVCASGICLDNTFGASCESSSGCGTGLACVPIASGTTPGSCGEIPRSGELCLDECAGGLACAGTCQPPIAEGEPCQTAWQACAAGLTCVVNDGNTTTDDGTCVAPAGLGDPCTQYWQCGASGSFSDLVCDEVGTHTCVTRPSSGPCIPPYDSNTGYGICDFLTSYCSPDAGPPGMCEPFLESGAACDPHVSWECGTVVGTCLAGGDGGYACFTGLPGCSL